MSRILVAYASRSGSTADVAEAIAAVLRAAGARVDVLRARSVRDVAPYDGVVVGSACRIGRVLPEAVAFVKRHRRALEGRPVAYFDVGLTMKDDTPENRAVAEGYLRDLRALVEPIATGTFAGRFERGRVGPLWRFVLARVQPDLPEGDFRDWGAVRAWARDLAPRLGLGGGGGPAIPGPVRRRRSGAPA